MSKYNKPLDRNYFKKKKDPKWDAKKKITKCCGQDIDHEVLNVFKKDDWELIEEHIRQHLHDYSNCETMTPISCEKCGRLLEYSCTLNEGTWKPGYLRR